MLRAHDWRESWATFEVVQREHLKLCLELEIHTTELCLIRVAPHFLDDQSRFWGVCQLLPAAKVLLIIIIIFKYLFVSSLFSSWSNAATFCYACVCPWKGWWGRGCYHPDAIIGHRKSESVHARRGNPELPPPLSAHEQPEWNLQ